MNVRFQTPQPTFNPGIKTHYSFLENEPGVYVYGLQLLLNGNRKFVPLYTGIAKNLKQRLWQHYYEEKSSGNSKKEVFKLDERNSVSSIIDLYRDMRMYDSFYHSPKHPLRLSIPSLIWFNDPTFFNSRLTPSISTYSANSGVMRSIEPGGDLDTMHTVSASLLRQEILNTKLLFDNHFYFIYARLSMDVEIPNQHPVFKDNYQTSPYLIKRANGPGKYICERIELATKNALSCKLGIHTTAKAVGTSFPMAVDLRNIQNSLVNIGGHHFGYPSYTSPLII